MNQVLYNGVTYQEDDVKDANCYMARSLLSDSLEMDTFSVDLISDTNLTPFQRNAPLVWFHRGQQMGTFYVQTIERVGKNKYHLETTSAIGLLDQSDHNGGIYTGQTLEELVADICTMPYIIKTDLLGTKLYGWLPIASRRANLSQVLFAIGATVKTDYNGVLRIEGLWSGVSGEIPEDNVFLGDSVRYDTPVTEVIVTEHQYVEGEEESTLFEGTASEGDVVQFSEPMHNVTAQGFTILEHGANYAILSSGNGILTGKKYTHTARIVSKAVSAADQPNTVKVDGATLVSLVNSESVADRLANYYKSIETINHDAVYQSEAPGDVVSLEHPYDEIAVTACIESVDIDMSGKLRATEKLLVGYTPPDIGETEYYDTVEVLTGVGEWTVPDGVTSIRAVVINSGDGGDGGHDGESGERVTLIVTAGGAPAGSTHQSPPGKGGKGGNGGVGGAGGKFLQTTLPVVPGDTIPYSCSVGGVAGDLEGVGNPGGESKFGELSGNDGNRSDTGFFDIITGATYAKKGPDGKKGGDGGDGGTANMNPDPTGKKGEDVPPNVGSDGTPYTYDEYGNPLTLRVVGGKGGGGAANGADGGGLTDGRFSKNGANAVPPTEISTYGSGGHGGHGGGASGGCGGIYFRLGNAASGGLWLIADPGDPGAGTGGSNGGDGCILIYYRLPIPRSNGALKDKSGLLLRDKHGRQLVV